MAPPRRGEARRRHGRLLLLAFAGLAALQLPSTGTADEPTVEPKETATGYAWSPSTVTASQGAAVAFRNPSSVVPHGVRWTGGPEKPSCSGVPVEEFGTSWSGTCSFGQTGTYTFVCTVHPEEMKGTIAVAAGEPPEPSTPGPGQPSAGPEGPAVEGLQLASRQRGGTVHAAITVPSAAVGGDLIVELKAPRAVLRGHGEGMVRVGRLRRALVAAGRLPFAVRLQPSAQHALHRLGHLNLLVTTVVKPPGGAATTITRRVKLSV
jgi:plastocyanin